MRAIEKIARERVIEKLLNIDNNDNFDLKDLSQDLYLSLLDKDEKLLEDLYNSGELIYYIKRMIKNNIFSKTSPFYRKYKHLQKITSELVWDSGDERY